MHGLRFDIGPAPLAPLGFALRERLGVLQERVGSRDRPSNTNHVV